MNTLLESPLSKSTQPQSAESIVNDSPRLLDDFPVGSVSHQGDLIFVRIASLPKTAKKRSNRQLADGNTQGSHHVLRDGIAIYDCDSSEVAEAIHVATKLRIGGRYIGPVFVSPENPTESDVTHPEHGNQGFEAGSVVACVYQRSLDAEQREARVRD